MRPQGRTPTQGARMSETEYLTERAVSELRAAILAFDVRVRLVHLELADAYAARLQELKRGAPPATNQRGPTQVSAGSKAEIAV